jgi:hypothetical protein
MPRTVSLGRTLVVATFVHAALFAFGRRTDGPGLGGVPIEPMKLVWVEAAPEVPPAPVARLPEADDSNRDLSLAAAVAAPHERMVPAPRASALALPESAPSTSGEWTLHITSDHGTSARSGPTLADLALDGKNHFLGGRNSTGEAEPDPERAARERGNRAAGEAMRAALHDNDVALGLGSGGPVVTALEDAVHAGTAPLDSHAVLVAIADTTGLVTRVDVESASEDMPSFRLIAEDVLNRLRNKRVRVPSSSHGLAIRIDVRSHLALPSGETGKGIGFVPRRAALTFDPSDIGARPAQVIHARILAEQLF